MVEAYECLARYPDGMSPSILMNSWPQELLEYADLDVRPKKAKLSPREVSLMTEALEWPVLHLSDNPIASDALSLWAFCKANNIKIAHILKKRNRDARERVVHLQKLADKNEAMIQKRREIASQVSAWANARIFQSDGSIEQVSRIKENAKIRFEREIIAANCQPVKITLQDAMPDKVLSRTSLDRFRKDAAEKLSDCLNKKGVGVR